MVGTAQEECADLALPEGAAPGDPLVPISPTDDYFTFINRIHEKQLEAVRGKVKSPLLQRAEAHDHGTSS
ncbi:hypothetical protein JRQ81_002338 [Phrynocephalus forsythii]|uniref:Uncharacterized protein n=1 Tax=Phrynocephalus forsythii TaxID=171643 RepID=A0A9Q0XIG2_9SAUR|nr:hypothetical protein JRQ81_002338 [Phrynocephalus forsythii]